MPSASSATHDASAARPPSSASMPALSSLQHASSSRNDADGSLPGHGLEFIANHHRQHNLNDPALKANPVKSRRSSLLPSVLKPKFKSESRRSLKPPLRSSTSAAAAPLQPRSSSRSVHNYSQSLPSFAAATVPRPRLDANMYEPSVCDPNTAQHHRSNAQRSAPGAHPGPDIADGMEAKASVFRPAYSPSTALLSSPVDQPEADGSICSSIHAKGLTFASMQVIPPASSSPTSFDSTSAPNTHSASRRQPLRNAAFVEEDFAGSETPIDNCIDSPAASQGHADPSEQSNDVSSVTAAAYPTPQPASNPAPPIITRTDVSDDNVSHQVEIASSPDLVAASFTPSVTPPSISTLGASASETSLYPPIQRLPQSASAPVISPRRFSSLGFASANNLANQTDPQSSSSASRTAARDVTEELDSPNSRESRSVRADRRMSMLDFLAAGPSADASPRRIQASLSAEDLSRSAHDTSSLRVRPSALTPPSVPLFQASRQFRLGATAMQARAPVSKTFDLCDQVRVSVEPLVDRLNMFGSMQSSSNYSLAGSVVVEIPRLNIPRLSTAAGLALDGSTTESPSVHVESLTVRFMGYSIYVDATGRYNAIKLTETFQELLPPEGHSCIVELNETATSTVQIASNEDDHQNLKYETEFDLSVPGWLPASQRSRFGATFYCVQATAIVQGQAVLSALSGFDGEFSQTSPSQSSPLSPPESLESELRETSMGTGAGSLRDANFATPATIGRSKSRKTWLNKTARQLQLRTSKKTTGTHSEQGGSASNSRRGSGSKDALQILDRQDPLFGKTTEVSNQVMPTGQHNIKSECLSILVRRCRDVVPVPVARLARLATASQLMRDAGTTPSLTQSMVALAGLHDGSAHDGRSQARLQSSLASQGGLHLPASASMPASLGGSASLPSQPVDREAASMATIMDSDSGDPAQADLAPSPRIDTHPPNFVLDPVPRDAEHEAAPNASNESSFNMPPAPSAFDAPRDPAKLAAATSSLTPSATLPNLPTSMSRASSLLDSRYGNANSPPRTSSRTMPLSRSAAPLRHFVHRPTLHLPPELGVTPDTNAADGLSFSLTLSLPSHVHITGPKSDVLSFGVQIEVGRTQAWDVLRKWGGLRLKDMEIVCLQTERHSSMPSRSFCATFPVPPAPNKVDAADLPVVTYAPKAASASSNLSHAQSAMEKRLRQSYDRSLVLGHITLANQGKEPHPIENNVERIRTTIVGPPPFASQDRQQDSDKVKEEVSRKGKAKSIARGLDRPDGSSRSPSRGSAAGSGANTPDGGSQSVGLGVPRAAFASASQAQTGSRTSVMQPAPRALTHSRGSSSSSLRLAFQGSDGSAAMQPRPSTSGSPVGGAVSPAGSSGRSRRPIPFDLSSATTPVSTSRNVPFSGLQSDSTEPTAASASAQADHQARGQAVRYDSDEASTRDAADTVSHPGVASESDAMRMGVTSSVTARGNARSRTATAPRRSRFETAINRLSSFASSMIDQPTEASTSGSGADSRGSANASRAATSLRATYAFSGDDGQGVDLTKGRVRMTINLPLVSSDSEAARKAGSAQLISDFESPYVRIRHKLKVKLGFGLKADVASGKDGEDWAQALVLCVPVRFTEAPPKEVQDQFGPVDLQPSSQSETPSADQTGDAATASTPASEDVSSSGQGLPVPFAEPLLPAYAQLFREDGSRLADEGEDLPRYPGRMSVVGEIDEHPISDLPAGHDSEAEGQDHSQGAAQISAAEQPIVSHGAEPPIGASERHESRELPRAEVVTLPRLSSLVSMPMPMDRTTSLPGRRLLSLSSSSGIYGLRSGPPRPSSGNSSSRAVSSPFAEVSKDVDTKPRFGSPAFDPLPARPGMRQRSATTASLVTFSRIMPAEVLDEALVTSALDDEEDRMDGMQPSDTLRSLNDGQRIEGMDESGQEDDAGDFDDEVEREEDLEDEAFEELDDGIDSHGVNSEASEAGHHRLRALRQLSGSEGSEVELVEGEIGRAF